MKWTAQWIWSDKAATSSNCYIELRNTFVISDVSNQIRLHISARNEYLVYLNGSKLGRGPSPCDSQWQYFDSYDITGMVCNGPNVLAVVCYHFGQQDIITGQMQGEAGFLAQIEQAVRILLTTDGSWKCRVSPRFGGTPERISRWGGYKEIYLARNEDRWETLDYFDDSWNEAVCLAQACCPDSPWPRLLPREIPFLRETLIRALDIVRTEANYGTVEHPEHLLHKSEAPNAGMKLDASYPGALPGAVFDFGREVVGRPLMTVAAPKGGIVRVAYGESLELQYIDTFILKEGTNRLQPFGRRACRYMQVTAAATPEPIVMTELTFEMTHYDFQQEGDFTSSNPMLNQIWEISKYTTLMNSHDHLEDCPWREKALWVADAVIMGKVIYSTFGDTSLLRKCLIQGARIQNADGSIPGTGPESNAFVLPDFCAYWLFGVEDYWRYTGELSFVEELWPQLTKLIGWFEAQIDETGLFAHADRDGWWCFIDWTETVDKRDKVTAISLLFYKVLQAMASMAVALNREEQAQDWRLRAERLRHSIYTLLWLPDQRMFSDCMIGSSVSERVSLQTNFLAIWCGVTVGEEAEYFLNEVYSSHTLPPITGAFFQHIVLEVLCGTGRKQQAANLIETYWGEMVARNATTWWETFDVNSLRCTIPSTYQGNTPGYLTEGVPVSLCHAWGASPAYILPRMACGIDISAMGQGYIALEHPMYALDWAKVTIPSQWGDIRIEWNSHESIIKGTIHVPMQVQVVKPVDYPLTVVAY